MTPRIIDEPPFREKKYIFKDRSHAGKLLAARLKKYVGRRDALVLAIPAGGVPVGCMVARALNLPLEVVVVRKIQIPWNTEAGFGGLSWNGTVLLNMPLVKRLGLSREAIHRSISLTQENVLNRARKFRGEKPFPKLESKTVLLVDDGLASGFTMLTAVKSTKKYRPKRIVVAVPTASLSSVRLVAPKVDELLCLNIRSGPFFAVADAYQQWRDLSEREVVEWLGR